MAFNRKLAEKLLEHYKTVERLPSWSQNHCIAGTLYHMGEIHTPMLHALERVLSVSSEIGINLYTLRSPHNTNNFKPFNMLPDDEARRSVIVAMLEELIASDGTKAQAQLPQ